MTTKTVAAGIAIGMSTWQRTTGGTDSRMQNPPLDLKAHLADADAVVDVLPWRLGETEAQRKAARGKVAGLTHQIAGLLAGGWTAEEIRAALQDAPGAVDAPDAGAQERLWRKALKRAKSHRLVP